MRNSTRKSLLVLGAVLIAGSFLGCVSVNKPKQNLVIYDFGLSISEKSHSPITSKIPLENPIAADALNHHKIRYRLNYQNSSRVFFYSESRWSTTPPELLSGKISQIVNFAGSPTSCFLKLKIEAFDHVFQTITDSEGVIQLSAIVVDRSAQKPIASQLITEQMAASTADAEGGTTALRKASVLALQKTIEWGNMVFDKNEQCR